MMEVKDLKDSVAVVLLSDCTFQMLGFDEQATTCCCVSYDVQKNRDDDGWNNMPSQSEFEEEVLKIFHERYAPKCQLEIDEGPGDFWCPNCGMGVETINAILPGYGNYPVRLCCDCLSPVKVFDCDNYREDR